MKTDQEKYYQSAEILKTLAHPVRLCIVKGLLDKGECNVTYMQSCLDTPQSTISQHLQKLRSVGIIEGRREGLEIYYKVKNPKVAQLVQYLLGDDK